MKYPMFLLALLFCSTARADSLSGSLREGPTTFVYSFDVSQVLVGSTVEDTLNGSIATHGGGPKGLTTYVDDMFWFQTGETVVLASFGSAPEWDLLANQSGIWLQDPPAVATPEPGVLVLLVLGLIVAWLLMVRRPTPPSRHDSLCSNIWRK